MKENFRDRVFDVKDGPGFTSLSIELFNYQYANNPVYRSFVDYLGKDPGSVKELVEIPFMPVEFFRDHTVITGEIRVEMIFESSGTAGMITAKHFITDLRVYEESFLRGFRSFYGDPGRYIIAALLPSYTERAGSSLVYMADRLIKETGHKLSGFYKEDITDFIRKARNWRNRGRKAMIIGVSFALLDLAESSGPDLKGFTVMETGGMKGRRREITREELHSALTSKLRLKAVHSEYGMTELLSQAYSKGKGLFRCPPWMKIILRDPQDPLSMIREPGKTGGINVIDLANINSCSFIATSDLGRISADGSFEVLGRFDNSDIRGCNLMVE
ncbi:MAG TPA: hypothetical protein VK155_06455 [Bacteroidales bacterium]|jgi:phenylacetate-coenzyme A ligase PaaK-like adenylate-forming protein|nr:hypothetical protein [Bacteroidales bacterium]